MAVYTIYSSTADATVTSQNSNYATARTGGSLSVNTTGTLDVGQNFFFGSYFIDETCLSFDTSSVTGTIVSATLSLCVSTNNSSTDFTVEARVGSFAEPVTSAAWISGASLSATLLATLDSSTVVTGAGNYNNFTDVALASNIDPTLTKIHLSSSRHRAGNTPTGFEVLSFTSANSAGTTSDPKLTIVTVDPTSGSTSPIFSTSGSLKGNGKLSGAPAPQFTTSGLIAGAGLLSSSITPAFTTEASIQADGSLIGALSSEFALSSFLMGEVNVLGSTSFSFSSESILFGQGSLSSSSDVVFAPVANLLHYGTVGHIDVSFEVEGTLRGSGVLIGTLSSEFSQESFLKGIVYNTGSSDLGFTPEAVIRADGRLYSETELTFSSDVLLSLNVPIFGSMNMVFNTDSEGYTYLLPYSLNYTYYPDTLYESNSDTAPFLYYETSGAAPDEIYEEN